MTIRFSKSSPFDGNTYRIYHAGNIIRLKNDGVRIQSDGDVEFSVRTFWFRTKDFRIAYDDAAVHSVKIGALLTPALQGISILFFIGLYMSTYIFEDDFLWYLATTSGLLWLLFLIYMYSFGSKYFIKVEITK